MTVAEALTATKVSMAITSTAYDSELTDLINAAVQDLESNGIDAADLLEDDNALVLQAIKTYCRFNFQSPADYDRLYKSYEAQKGHMRNCTGYTTWDSEVTTDGES